MSLTVVDTPGFGDAVDNTDCWEPVTNFVENQFEKFLDAETRVNRVELPDNRVHACLYFIAPSGHGLKPLDIEFMKRLHDKVNIIPVIGKSDAFTPEEIATFKTKVTAIPLFTLESPLNTSGDTVLLVRGTGAAMAVVAVKKRIVIFYL